MTDYITKKHNELMKSIIDSFRKVATELNNDINRLNNIIKETETRFMAQAAYYDSLIQELQTKLRKTTSGSNKTADKRASKGTQYRIQIQEEIQRQRALLSRIPSKQEFLGPIATKILESKKSVENIQNTLQEIIKKHAKMIKEQADWFNSQQSGTNRRFKY